MTGCKEVWFGNGGVCVWAGDELHSSLPLAQRHILKESLATPLCTVVECGYPDPENLDEIFPSQAAPRPPDALPGTMHVIKRMDKRP